MEKDSVKAFTVVDLNLTPTQIWAKFENAPKRIAKKNMAKKDVTSFDFGDLLDNLSSQFTAFLAVFAVIVFALSQWRSNKMFTMRCLKCDTPFCKRCHLRATPSGLCTQCYHLFVVRDGVSD